ncbi:MAG TPA: FAD:protein FMN transferase [Polyangiaceae bacterium]
MLTIEFKTMGCHASALLDAEGAEARAAFERLPAWFAIRERILSRFDPASALVRLNARGEARVDDVLWAATEVALAAADATDGLVTPTVLPALDAAGYDRSFANMERDQRGALAAERPVPDWRAIDRDETTRSIRLPPGVRLDLGGTAKGWCADVAASSLARFGPALVDVGGDIATAGTREPWLIAIEDPRGGRDALELVRLRGGGIATSGRDLRRWRRAGVEHHHLIDPRTGAPARTDVWTVTVIGPSALEAEIAAKRVFLEGSRAGMAWIGTRPELAALVVREDGTMLQSARFARHVGKEAA